MKRRVEQSTWQRSAKYPSCASFAAKLRSSLSAAAARCHNCRRGALHGDARVSGSDLEAAIKGNALARGKGRVAALAHKLLGAVAFLADNGVIHRDIKSENIMLSEDMTHPVLIDCSLAVIERRDEDGETYRGRSHSGDVGSAGYIAPEVYEKKPYGTKADAWSIGVVIMELFRGKMLEAEKDKQSFKRIKEVCEAMPSKPFPNLIRSLLVEDPESRASARSALGCPLFVKNELPVPKVRIVDIMHAIPSNAMDAENDNGNGNGKRERGKKSKTKQTRAEKNVLMVKKFVSALGCKDRRTYLAAEAYAKRVAKQPVEELLHEDEEGMMRYCAVLAQKLFEEEKWDLDDLENPDEDDVPVQGFENNFSVDDYVIAEQEIFRIMQYCLHSYEFSAALDTGKKSKKRKK